MLIVLTAQAVTGCSVYSFNPRGQSDIQTIAIEPFENQTSEYGLADRLTEVIVDAFIADGNLRVVSADGADAVLVGTLTHYERTAEKFDENDQVEEYKIIMDFRIALRNPDDQADIWSEQMRQEGIYNAVEESEEEGQERAGARLVQAVIDKTTKSW